jgi:hypothetical protein
VSVSSVEAPAAVIVTAAMAPAGAWMVAPPIGGGQGCVHVPPVSTQPPWMVMPAGSVTCSVYVPFAR